MSLFKKRTVKEKKTTLLYCFGRGILPNNIYKSLQGLFAEYIAKSHPLKISFLFPLRHRHRCRRYSTYQD